MKEHFRALSRDQIHPDLWRAKGEFVSRCFHPLEQAPGTRRGIYSTSTSHERNVIGVGVGRKISGGKGTDDYAVRVYVRRKLPLALLGKQRVPDAIDGVKTDVIEIEPFRALADSTAIARSRMRPIRAGASVGFFDGQQLVAGTITSIVTRDGDYFILSNNHVLAFENRLAPGAEIIQPASLDGGQEPGDAVATLTQFIPLDPADNQLDAAIAKIDAGITTSPTFAAGMSLTSTASLQAQSTMAVGKVGRGTGFTMGVIDDLDITAQVEFETGQFTFSNQLLIASGATPFASVGDSGSLVVSTGARIQPVAMLFGGQSQYALATPIDRVLAALNIAIAN
jgi:hypothetical protein